MRWLIPVFVAALSCGGARPPQDFALRVGVVGELGEVTPDAHSGGAVLATDLIFETLLRPTAGGWDSRFLRRWERIGTRSWRLEVETDARFSDGSRVVTADVAEAVRRRGYRVTSVGTSSLEVEAGGAGPLEGDLARAVVSRKGEAHYLGTAAFQLVVEEPARLVMTRVVPAPGRVQRVEIVPCASGREALVKLLRGEIGALPALDPVSAELLDGVPTIRIVRGSAPHATAIMLNPRLPVSDRKALVGAIPVDEVAAAIRREPCCGETAVRRAPPPPGRRLSIGYPRSVAFRRAALALRQGLGDRGGAVEPFGLVDLQTAAKRFDLLVMSVLVRPPGSISSYLRSRGEWNFTGYSNPRYDAALATGDETLASEALAADPAMVVIGRRERMGAVDARLTNAQLGDWGVLETLPDWEVSP